MDYAENSVASNFKNRLTGMQYKLMQKPLFFTIPIEQWTRNKSMSGPRTVNLPVLGILLLLADSLDSPALQQFFWDQTDHHFLAYCWHLKMS